MKSHFSLLLNSDQTITTIYQDGLAETLGAEVVTIKRASHIEWSNKNTDNYRPAGWIVQSAKNPKMIIRWKVDHKGSLVGDLKYTDGPCCVFRNACTNDYADNIHVSDYGPSAKFATREQALHAEEHFFWELLNTKEEME
jgi:hypothetical protein